MVIGAFWTVNRLRGLKPGILGKEDLDTLGV